MLSHGMNLAICFCGNPAFTDKRDLQLQLDKGNGPMDKNESDKTILKNSKIQSPVLKVGDRNRSFRPGPKDDEKGQKGFSGFMSVPLDGTIGDDILFSSEMPRAVPWSVAWADVMMTMFVIFAAMYIFKAQIKEKIVLQPQVKTEYVEKIKEVPQPSGISQSAETQSIQEIYDLSKKSLNSVSSVELVPDKAVRIILKSDLLFDEGKANIREDAKASLRKVADIIQQTPYMVDVVGHTDDLPINTQEFPSNWELSTARACGVARFLMKDINLPEERFYVTGHANYQPIKPNTNDQNRAANRRVEIIITKKKPHAVSMENQ
jgi:outer membrane protein OmpA-like peptidoglycan-associated protein